MNVISTSTYVSISDHRPDGLKAIASADFIGPHWWIGRVLVDPENRRGEGVGSKMLTALIQAVVEQGGTEIHVTPGGYSADSVRQTRFYERHGFVREGEEGLLVWRP
jgi:predicted GNAT family N-acyltransferase